MSLTLGIRREDKNRWERRVPLVPADVARLLAMTAARLTLQPAPRRCCADADYLQSGATIAEDLSACDLVLGIKEMPVDFFRPGGAYLFFSHTIKGQVYNRPMLRRLVDLGCTLLDYERIVDAQNRRLVLFGRFAGLAGMIDALAALGARLTVEGIATPLARVRMAHEYPSLPAAKLALRAIGEEIARHGLPAAICPLVIGFTGDGHVSRGAREILAVLPHTLVPPDELTNLPTLGNAGDAERRRLFGVVFTERHTVAPNRPGAAFDLAEFHQHPDRYHSVFRTYIDHLAVLVNGIYWSPKHPRLLTRADAAEWWAGGRQPRLRVVADISCDIDGGVEFTVKSTTPDSPTFVWDPAAGRAIDGVEGHGPVVMAVDNLPCELPVESSTEFSRALMPLLERMSEFRLDGAFADSGFPPELQRAVLLWRGEFPPEYQFMREFVS